MFFTHMFEIVVEVDAVVAAKQTSGGVKRWLRSSASILALSFNAQTGKRFLKGTERC